MQKTTVYLPEDLKAALVRAAAATRKSEAQLIREGIQRVTEEYGAPAPKLPLFRSGQPGLGEQVDEILAGFGER